MSSPCLTPQATSDAVKKMTGVVSSGLQRTGNLITRSRMLGVCGGPCAWPWLQMGSRLIWALLYGSGAGKPLTKAQKKGSRADLASMANEQPGAKTGKDRRKGSRQNLAAGRWSMARRADDQWLLIAHGCPVS